MTTLFAILKGAGVLLIGLTLRVSLLVLVLAALSVPVLLVYLGVQWWRRVRQRLLDASVLAGLPWHSGLLHTSGHLWMKPGAEGFKVGVDGIAARLLPGVERVALPMAGAHLRRGEPIAEVVTASRRVPIPAPVDGTVARINRVLQRNPRKVERDPYVGGWLVTLRPRTAEAPLCLEGASAREWFGRESRRLAQLLDQEMGVASADGGERLAAPEKALTKEQWDRLTSAFLTAA